VPGPVADGCQFWRWCLPGLKRATTPAADATTTTFYKTNDVAGDRLDGCTVRRCSSPDFPQRAAGSFYTYPTTGQNATAVGVRAAQYGPTHTYRFAVRFFDADDTCLPGVYPHATQDVIPRFVVPHPFGDVLQPSTVLDDVPPLPRDRRGDATHHCPHTYLQRPFDRRWPLASRVRRLATRQLRFALPPQTTTIHTHATLPRYSLCHARLLLRYVCCGLNANFTPPISTDYTDDRYHNGTVEHHATRLRRFLLLDWT